MAAETPERTGGGADNFFTRKLGPLPVWAWAAIGAGGAYLWWRHKQNTAGASTTSAASTADTGTDYGPSFAAIQSEIQQLQGEESAEGSGDTDDNGTPTSGGGSGVSRSNRSPKVRRQIHEINKEHNQYEKSKQGTRPSSSAVKTSSKPGTRTTGKDGGPARTTARRAAPKRTTTTRRRAG